MIPLVLEESGGSEESLIFTQTFERDNFLGEQVTSETSNRIVAQLLFLRQRIQCFHVYYSPGG